MQRAKARNRAAAVTFSHGTPGTYEGMRHGSVDESWARKHHAVWYEDVKAGRDGTPTDEIVSSPEPPIARARPA